MVQRKKLKLQSLVSASSFWKLILPITIGLLVVIWMLWRNFDTTEFLRLSWNATTVILILSVVMILIIRHLAYSWRLRIMSHDFFGWKKSIELIFLWEFASTISPTSIGGSATAIILLTQEQYKTAQSVSLILYSVVLDTVYLLITLPFFLLLFGPILLRPELESIWSLDGYAWSFYVVYFLMMGYGFFFFYGLFIDPKKISQFLVALARIKWLRKFKEGIHQTSVDIIVASNELQKEDWRFHSKAMLATTVAWTCRFATVPLIVFAVLQLKSFGLSDFLIMLGRHEAMFVLTAFSPTPGGSGVTEALFGGFFSDYLNASTSIIVAILWRLMTYYSYLFAGIIILPLWLRKVMLKRKKRRQQR